MRVRSRVLLAGATAALVVSSLPFSSSQPTAVAVPNPVATDDNTYQVFGRVFPDPQGCLAAHAPDTNGDHVKDTPRGISPWAKGNVCASEFLSYEEVLSGVGYLAKRFPDFVSIVRLDQFLNDPDALSAGIPRDVVVENGSPQALGRDRRPLYLLKVTDARSAIPEAERRHFAYSLSIHGIERAGLEGGVRTLEDLVTWAACERKDYATGTPACTAEGPFPKRIVETPTAAGAAPAPTAGDVLRKAVVYFAMPNPDGWARGQVAPVETRDGNVNPNYTPGVFFQRYNGNGVDVNRDFPTIGYSYRPYTPDSEPEVKAFTHGLKKISNATAAGKFAGGIDLHGMLTAHAFSYTLLGAGQRDFRKNALSVDTAIRAWRDQTERLKWSPWVADANGNGAQETTEPCATDPVLGGGSRGRVPACVADEWGTVIDTIGYQVTGGFGDWIDSPMGLDAVGIDNEMYTSHLAPDIVFEPALEQTHVDGNKGLVFSQLATLLEPTTPTFVPTGKVGYVMNPQRLQVGAPTAAARSLVAPLPSQVAVDVTLPCSPCSYGTYSGTGNPIYEFDVKGPAQGVHNHSITASITKPSALGVSDGNEGAVYLEFFDEGVWHGANADFNQATTYFQAGQTVSANDPQTGRWRLRWDAPAVPTMRVHIDFGPSSGEERPVQTPIDASSMDFFTDLNKYVPAGKTLEPVPVATVVSNPAALNGYDSILVVDAMGTRAFVKDALKLSPAETDAYFANLGSFAKAGGNLVLTDAALQTAAELGIVPAAAVKTLKGLAGDYAFRMATGNTYDDVAKYPLTRGIKKPGAAEQTIGTRQGVEPTPLGYSPDLGLDADPSMPFFAIDKAAWEKACPRQPASLCTTATTTQLGTLANFGEVPLGQGRVRIAGTLLPNPIFAPGKENDARFGLASYALTYTGYDVFTNLVDFARASATSAPSGAVKTEVKGAVTGAARLPATGRGTAGLAVGATLVAGAGLLQRGRRRRLVRRSF
jgi:hypothetical protein